MAWIFLFGSALWREKKPARAGFQLLHFKLLGSGNDHDGVAGRTALTIGARRTRISGGAGRARVTGRTRASGVACVTGRAGGAGVARTSGVARITGCTGRA